ncbi:MAG: hypothetical protein EOS23_31705 [Mesorhizobium sp.]|uniref:hypothetical protein n=1 Tax=Mesorhizobium sp. TaxID=1871066 RepID=UPI000FE8E58A|nr:hypothetical protein [Mesorhizobium sp.]RWE06184.1 MAG: hypothetical protein EOS23_31705 [Mesorhizobium sp.]TIV81281.1 MAG: hypothetical protein E5V64_16625 [Mesorhizobium sp.]
MSDQRYVANPARFRRSNPTAEETAGIDLAVPDVTRLRRTSGMIAHGLRRWYGWRGEPRHDGQHVRGTIAICIVSCGLRQEPFYLDPRLF